jgi:hypothetical protein
LQHAISPQIAEPGFAARLVPEIISDGELRVFQGVGGSTRNGVVVAFQTVPEEALTAEIAADDLHEVCSISQT